MWIDITRGLTVLEGAWSNTSAADSAGPEPRIRPDASDDYLEQAQTYFNLGRPQSAAILAGDVLRETLRKLCRRNRVPLVSRLTVNDMNSELAKRGVYNVAVAQRLSHLTNIWNKANCGQWSDFSKTDVQLMLGEVRAFVTDYATNQAIQ
ncbi:MAG TPA: hypothetical protein VE083_05865 [Terriglobales bacterium]|nr:hypothetical protein [Terriglobales bacterium]